jgi:hypothetical protein
LVWYIESSLFTTNPSPLEDQYHPYNRSFHGDDDAPALQDLLQHGADVFPTLAPSLFGKFQPALVLVEIRKDACGAQEAFALRDTFGGEAFVIEQEYIEYLDCASAHQI